MPSSARHAPGSSSASHAEQTAQLEAACRHLAAEAASAQRQAARQRRATSAEHAALERRLAEAQAAYDDLWQGWQGLRDELAQARAALAEAQQAERDARKNCAAWPHQPNRAAWTEHTDWAGRADYAASSEPAASPSLDELTGLGEVEGQGLPGEQNEPALPPALRQRWRRAARAWRQEAQPLLVQTPALAELPLMRELAALLGPGSGPTAC